MQKILITTGGTGGHVIPAKIISEHLADEYEIYYSTDLRGSKYLFQNEGKVVLIDTPRLNFNISLPYNLIKLIYLLFVAFSFLRKKNFKKVISTGGYMSLPIVISAKILGIPILLLEPNLVLGRANRFFLNFSKNIFCYSGNLLNFPKKYKNKIVLIKPLIFKNIYELKKRDKFNEKFCFLIFGGSQGAKIFDNLINQVMVDISKKFEIKVIQQTSKENIENLKNFYKLNNIENIIFNYEKELINFINISDFCITRAGATSLAEISFLEKPFITIPLPTAKDDHQMKNAKYYEELGCCWIMDQKSLDRDNLSKFIFKILNDKTSLISKKQNLKKLNYANSWNYNNHELKKIINEY